MAQTKDPRSPLIVPLWLIAIALVAIALCLLLRSGERQQSPQATSELEPVSPAPETRIVTNGAGFRERLVRVISRPPEPAASGTEPPPSPTTESALATVDVAPVTAPMNQPAVAGGLGPLHGLVDTNGLGTIEGTVVLNGVAPPETIIDTKGNRECGNSGQPLLTREFVVSTNGELADTIVSIRQGLSTSQFPLPSSLLNMRFTNCLIEPHVAAAMLQGKVIFHDADGVRHEVLLESAHGNTAKFELAPGATSTAYSLDSVGMARIRCETHPWEEATIVVLRNPYFAVTDTDGRFEISNVPPGTYVLEAVHISSTATNRAVQQVIVNANRTTRAGFSLKAP